MAAPQLQGRRLQRQLVAASALSMLLLYCARHGPFPRVWRQMATVAPLALAAAGSNSSRCGPTATARGPHQRAVSFNFYGDVDHARGYFEGIARNAAAVDRLYPGWTMRLYHELPPGDSSAASRRLHQLSSQFPHLDLCYVGDVPGYGDLRGRQQNAWRFLAMADPLVDVFISRDLDAMMLQREVDAVNEWLSSNATFHVMRDHPYHDTPILAGMWGARPDLKREPLRQLAELICAQPKGEKAHDQELLSRHLWPAIRGDVWQHDNYHCDKYRSHGHMRAFPTARNLSAYNFVGNRVGIDTEPLSYWCPLQCRPAQNPDWHYC